MPDSLKIVVLARAVASLHGLGGLERHVHDLLRHLLRQGVWVTLITRRPPSAVVQTPGLFDHEHLTVRLVPYRSFPLAGRRGTTVLDRSSAYPIFGWRAGRLAARIVRAGGIDLVHGLGASAWGYARARQRDWFGTVPFVFNPQGLEEFGATDPSRVPLKRLGYRPLQIVVRSCARAADRVIATDEALVSTVRQHLLLDEARVSVVPNAIDLEEVDRLTHDHGSHDIRGRLGLAPDDVLLVGVGRLEENKGFQDLIPALASLKIDQARAQRGLRGGWRCVVLGDGPYRETLKRAIASAGLVEYVLLPGRVSDAELHAWYEAATLFVHPTRYEGSSLVTLEAMAHRRAVIATSAGGLPDKISPGRNGWLVQPGNVQALATALAEALEHRDRLGAMGQESRLIVERKFAWDAVIVRLLNLYESVLRGRPARSDVRGFDG